MPTAHLLSMNPKVKEYIDKQPSPQKEICLKLREIILDTITNFRKLIPR